MASPSSNNRYSPNLFDIPTPGPLQCHTHARVMRFEGMMKDVFQLVTEIQVKQIQMGIEQQRQGRLLRDLHKFMLDNPHNPIVIDEDEPSNARVDSEEEEPMEEEEEAFEEDDDAVICVGKVSVDREGNVVEKNGNFCLHYPNCSFHKSPIV